MANSKPMNRLEIGWPERPRGLTAPAKRQWIHLCEQLDADDRLSPSLGPLIEAAAVAYAKAKAADTVIAKAGATIQTTFYDRQRQKAITTGSKPRPEVAIARQSWAAYRAALKDLGLVARRPTTDDTMKKLAEETFPIRHVNGGTVQVSELEFLLAGDDDEVQTHYQTRGVTWTPPERTKR